MESPLIVIPRLQELDPIVLHSIEDTVFFGNSTRPSSCTFVFEGFRFAYADEWFANYGVHQIEDLEEQFSVILSPVTKVFAEGVT